MAATEGSDLTFPEVDASRELNLGVPEQFTVDPVSSRIESAKEEAAVKAKAIADAEAAKCGRGSTLMSALAVSGVVVAAIGVAFIVSKKLRES